jgi:hypothetical protein
MIKYLFWGFVCGAIIGGASYLPHADAQAVARPSICASFDAAPTFSTVNAVMWNLVGNGMGKDQAANTVVDAVATHCPQHIPLLQNYVATGIFLFPEITQ